MTDSRFDRDVLDALCRCVVPAAYDEAPPVDVVTALVRRIETLPAIQQHDLATALRLFDHPFAALLDFGRPGRFRDLPAPARERRLRSWEMSAIPIRRTIFQSLRRLIVSAYYGIPEVQTAIGYRGPFRDRSPVVAWEGPIAGAGNGVIAGDADVHAVHTSRATETVQRASNADEITSGSSISCDVVIVGSGAGGAVAAARLAEAGLSVVVLEEGGHYTTADFNDVERDMIPRLYADAGARATDDGSISLLQGSCVGGGSIVNWMLMLRPRPFVMEEWETEYGAEMFGASMLIPAIERVESELGAGFLPPGAHSTGNRLILDGAAALGWSAEEARINAQGCVRAGTCGLGCSHGAKRSAGEVYVPRAIAAGASVISHARAERITDHAGGKRVTVTALAPASSRPLHRFSVDAARVVVAAGAVGTPVLLQKSGLGNRSVGSWLRLHPTTAVRGIYDRVVYGAAGVPQSALLSEFMEGESGYGFWVECPPMLPSLASVAVGGFGAEHRNAMREFPNMAAFIVLTRDGAARTLPSGYISTARDGRVRIRYRPHRLDRAQITAGIAAAARLHFASGAREVVTLHTPALTLRTEGDIDAVASASTAPNRLALFSAHVNGTCRMGKDAAKAACAPDGQLFGHPGVFVADGSLFPTAPGVNPQAAIMAAASLVAERVAASLAPTRN